MPKKIIFPCLLLSCFLISCASQGGPSFHADEQPLSSVPWMNLNQVRLEPQDSSFNHQPLRFAEPVSVDVSPYSTGVWDSTEDGRLRWRLGLSASNARNMRLVFSQLFLPPDTELQILSDSGEALSPKYDARRNSPTGGLRTDTIPSNAVIIALKTPPERQAELRLKLTTVNIGYR